MIRKKLQSSKENGVKKIARVALSPDAGSISRFADKYFLRTKDIVEKFGDTTVTYAVFMRRPVTSAPRLAIDWLHSMARARQTSFKIDLKYKEGSWVGAGEPIVYITGSLFHLVDLETQFLQKLGSSCVAAYNSYVMCVCLLYTSPSPRD